MTCKDKAALWLASTVHRSDDHRIYWKFAKSLCRDYNLKIIIPASKLCRNDDANIQIQCIDADETKISRISFLIALLKMIISNKPRYLIFFDFETLLIVPFIRILSPSTRIIYDNHEDFISMVMASRKFSRPAKIIASTLFFIIEILTMPLCSGITVSDRYLLNRSSKVCRQSEIVYNFPVFTEIDRKRHMSKPFKFVYAGGLYFERALKSLINYFSASEYSLTLIGRTFTDQEDEYLRNAVEKYDNIEHLEHMEYDVLLNHLGNYDFGLVYMNLNKKFRRNISVKQFDYMMAGLPVFIRKGLVSSITDNYTGFNIDRLEDIKHILTSLSNSDIERMRINCRHAIQYRLNWCTEKRKLLDFLISIR